MTDVRTALESRYASKATRLDWPGIVLTQLARLGARGEALPTNDGLADLFGIATNDLQKYMRILELRGQINVVRDNRNERLAVYPADGSWRLERKSRGGQRIQTTARRCIGPECGGILWHPPHPNRWLCHRCTNSEVMGS